MKRLPLPKFLRHYLTFSRPLCWAQLSHQKTRLAVALMGVSFSNILIFTQLGLRALLFDGVTLVPEHLKGDLFLISTYAPSISFGSFPQIHLYQADAIAGVAMASPLYITSAPWVNPLALQQPEEPVGGDKSAAVQPIDALPYPVKILAFNPTQPVLNIPEVNQQLEQLQAPGAILFDRLGQPQLGPVPTLVAEQGVLTTVMNNRKAHVVGLFSMGSTFFDKGHVIMSDWNYARRNGQDSLQKVAVGALTLEAGVDPITVQKQISQNLSEDVRALTREELLAAEHNFRASFPEGKILNFGAAIGFIVGVVIVYQVLYTDVSDHLPEYATLKAMGYSDRALLLVVLQEALLLAVLGFFPGYLTSYWIYDLLTKLTKIPLVMRPEIIVQVFMLTLIMCVISGAIAMNKLRSADPADVF
ncbi:MAG: FtsX-like permease family protein [Cyanothece sp. SIO1E1]|nr:FtsX-like permease family protein [Cyanothece sp. SIO1E1]